MVRRNAHQGAHREFREGQRAIAAHFAMLLMGARDNRLPEGPFALPIQHDPKTKILRCGLSAAILGKRNPPRINQHRITVHLARCHSRKHRDRDIFHAMRADLALEQIAEHIDARANIRDAHHGLPVKRGGRRPGRDNARRDAHAAQTLGGQHRAGAFRFRHLAHAFFVAFCIGMPGMCHDAGTACPQALSDFRECG